MSKNILVLAEIRDGKIKKASLEALSEARTLAAGGVVSALLIGEGVAALAPQLAEYGAAKVYTAEDARLKLYAPRAYTTAAVAAAKSSGATLILAAGTSLGRDLAPRVAARLGWAAVPDVTAVSGENFRRPCYSGKAFQTVAIKGSGVVTLRPNVFPAVKAAAPAAGAVEACGAAFTDADFACKVESLHIPEKTEIDVAEADVIVSGGRGMKGPEHMNLVSDLAHALGGAVGASRAIVDAGWIDHQHQVGQTGKVVSPSLYIACGISGAIQHLAGMSSSKIIVAINKDADAPIFKVADYGIVGDVFAILPALTAEIKKLKES